MSVSTIRTKIRYLLGDYSKSGDDIFIYDNTNIFTLSETNIVSVDNVFKNDVEVGTSETIYDSDTNKVTINLTLAIGDTIQVKYTYYADYSQTELLEYIQSALVHLSLNNYKELEYDITTAEIYPEVPLREENLIAIIASILINPDNKSIKLSNITLSAPNDLPLNDRISKTIALFKKNSSGLWNII